MENSAVNSALEILSKDDFYSEAHRKIFGVIIELSEKNEAVDLITLSNALKDKSLLDSVGGTSYLASLVDNVPSAANVANYAKIVKEKAILRGLIGSATEIISSCYEPVLTLMRSWIKPNTEFLKFPKIRCVLHFFRFGRSSRTVSGQSKTFSSAKN